MWLCTEVVAGMWLLALIHFRNKSFLFFFLHSFSSIDLTIVTGGRTVGVDRTLPIIRVSFLPSGKVQICRCCPGPEGEGLLWVLKHLLLPQKG